MQMLFENPHNQRFYFMAISEDLLGQHEIVISHGSAMRRPILRYLRFNSYIDAMYEYYKIAKLRIKHGYKETQSKGE